MENVYRAYTLPEAERFLESLPPKEEAKLRAEILVIESGDFQSAHTKTLRGPIKELIVGNYRLIFFIAKDHTVYFTGGFRKKSAKTPKQEIDKAERIYKLELAQHNERQKI